MKAAAPFTGILWLIAATVLSCSCETRMNEITVESIGRANESWALVTSDADRSGTDTFVSLMVSSEQDLLDFRQRWQLQIRCELEARSTGVEFSTAAWGPFHKGHDVSRPSRLPADFRMSRRGDGRYEYQLYVFPHLAASEFRDHQFLPTPLEQIDFEAAHCYLIGVTKAPVLFPRSNVWTVSKADLLRDAPLPTTNSESTHAGN